MLNARHKILLFVTLVVTGTALLAGAQISEALGLLILGAAFAWVIGSRTVSNVYKRLRTVPGKAWPCIRLLICMALAGAVLVVLAVICNYNSFLVTGGMCVFWLLISPLRAIPLKRWFSKAGFWLVSVGVFFSGTVAASVLISLPTQNAERIGQLCWNALIALPIVFLWLSKGRRLVLTGMTAKEGDSENSVISAETPQPRTGWLYSLLLFGSVLTALLIGVVTFSQVSDSVMHTANEAERGTNLAFAGFLMLLGWGMYSCWQKILRRESNSVVRNVRRHRAITAALGAVFVIVVSVGIVFGIQNGNDRKVNVEIESMKSSFQQLGEKIGAIKSRNFQTTQDYIGAYGELEPLVSDFDTNLSRIDALLDESQQRDRNRGPLNIQRFYSHHTQMVEWDRTMFALLHEDSELTKQQIAMIKEMGKLPSQYQVSFWRENVKPLLDREDSIRQRLQSHLNARPST